jgi:hypothetical protein
MMLELSGQPSAATARRNLLGSPVLFDQEAQMDANSGEPWSEMDISDLTNDIAHGRTMAETASFLSRDENEVRQKAKELGL